MVPSFFNLVEGIKQHLLVEFDVLGIFERRRLETLTSAGAIASVPYAREKGVDLVDPLGVVRWLHRTPSSSSAQ